MCAGGVREGGFERGVQSYSKPTFLVGEEGGKVFTCKKREGCQNFLTSSK